MASSPTGAANALEIARPPYPNPARDRLNIDPAGSQTYTIVDALGAVRAMGPVHRVLDVSALPVGMYMLLLEHVGAPAALRFVVER